MVDIKKRLSSLDAFRGMTIAGMILVNTPGSWAHVYPPLLHADWHGWTPTDLVFPFFLFIVGVSMSFSFSKFEYKLTKESAFKLWKRGLLIFLIGLLLNAFPFIGRELSDLRIMGVLQRIAFAFVIGGMIILLCKGRRWPIAIASVLLLFIYWGILAFLGGDQPYSLEGNFIRKIDLLLLGEPHLYGGFGIPFDPEGLLSGFSASANVLIGFLVGKTIRDFPLKMKTIIWVLIAGVVLFVTGIIWGLTFPVNKPLWTSSYVLLTCGLAMIVFMLFYWLIDMRYLKRWSNFFIVFGMNPLFGFALSVIWVKILIYLVKFKGKSGEMTNGYTWMYRNLFEPLAGPLNGSLLFAIFHIVFFWLILLWLYKRKIFIKI